MSIFYVCSQNRLEEVLVEAQYFLLDPDRDYKLVILYNCDPPNISRVADLLVQKLTKTASTNQEIFSSLFPRYPIEPKIVNFEEYSVFFGVDYNQLLGIVNSIRKSEPFSDPNLRSILLVGDPNNSFSNYLNKEGVYSLDLKWILGL